MTMMHLEDYLKLHAERQGDKVAVVCGDRRLTYRQWYAEATALAATLNPTRGRGMVFRASQSIDFLTTYFAIHLAGGVAVPLEQSVPQDAFEAVEREVEGATLPQGTADVLFTTGTTGRQKGVVISHSTIVANAENLVAAQGYSPGITFIICGPLNHIGSLSKVYPTLLVGGTLHILEGMKDMDAFFRAIEAVPWKAATFMVPASIRMMLAFSAERMRKLADKVDFIETGAAPMSEADMERLCDVLPHSRLFNTYASTETGIISTYDYHAYGCKAGCVGSPMRHSSVTIADDGHIVCHGKTLMTGYLADDALTCSVLRDGDLHTADLGMLDGEGRLHLTGRKGDIINVGGFKVAPVEVEDAALQTALVRDCICVQAQHPVLGSVLKLLVVTPDNCPLDKRQLALALKARLEAYKVPMLYQQVDSIKRTYNGKLNREYYKM